MQSVNPHNGQVLKTYEEHGQDAIEERLARADRAFHAWSRSSIESRCQLMRRVASVLREQKQEFAELMAREMGKVLKEGLAEIEKCAWCCDFYAEEGPRFLADEESPSDASRSYIRYEPLGAVLAVMPWNFPFWQVFRFAAPSLIAGNVGVLKHASQVSGVSLAIEGIFRKAGFPEHVFTSLLISGEKARALVADPRIKAVTLTGSTVAGQSIASAAGQHLKKSVLELGGSDAYLILDDADVEQAASICSQSRLMNAGQSCIAAKRFIVAKPLMASFLTAMQKHFEAVRWGDPLDAASTMGPLSRVELRQELHEQVQRSIQQGAQLITGGKIPDGSGAYYPPTILAGVKPGMAAFDEELFGPVAAVIEARDEGEAIQLANRSVFGLGSAIFTRHTARAKAIIPQLEAGSVFVNALVKSDPRLPFGGIKASGYGRELSQIGIREFVNIKTVYFA